MMDPPTRLNVPQGQREPPAQRVTLHLRVSVGHGLRVPDAHGRAIHPSILTDHGLVPRVRSTIPPSRTDVPRVKGGNRLTMPSGGGVGSVMRLGTSMGGGCA